MSGLVVTECGLENLLYMYLCHLLNQMEVQPLS